VPLGTSFSFIPILFENSAGDSAKDCPTKQKLTIPNIIKRNIDNSLGHSRGEALKLNVAVTMIIHNALMWYSNWPMNDLRGVAIALDGAQNFFSELANELT
jgi:hypothetical protein